MKPFKKLPYAFMGNKMYMYESYIKPLVKESNKKQVIDYFAGGLGVDLLIKRDFPEIKVHANVYDPVIHGAYFLENPLSVYDGVVEYLFDGKPQQSSKKTRDTDPKKWREIKERFWKIKLDELSDEERGFLILFFFMNRSKNAISHCFYSPQKRENIKAWKQALTTLDSITTIPMRDVNDRPKNALLLYDPPYIKSTIPGNKKKSYGYAYGKAHNWDEKDNAALLEHISRTKGRGNRPVIFGAPGNDLMETVVRGFPQRTLHSIRRYRNIYGRMHHTEEWMIVIDN